MRSKNIVPLFLILLHIGARSSAQEYSDKQVRIFPISQETSVEITNKYGKVHIITWDLDSVKFEADLHIVASSIEKMQKLRNNISFDFTATKYYAIAKTNFANAGNVITDFKDAIIPSNQVTINYTVSLPKQINLKIDNKYGDVYIDDFSGNLDIIVSNGDLKANALTGNSTINISAGDGIINKIHAGKILTSYSDMRIRQADNVELDTKLSKITIDKVESIMLNSRRDKYDITEVADISMNGYFSDLHIAKLLHELRATLKYGNVSVDNISEEFSFLNIDSECTDIDLFFDHDASFSLDISHHYDVVINLPAGSSLMQTKDQNIEQKMKLTYGKIGNKTGEDLPKVNISASKNCNINIGLK